MVERAVRLPERAVDREQAEERRVWRSRFARRSVGRHWQGDFVRGWSLCLWLGCWVGGWGYGGLLVRRAGGKEENFWDGRLVVEGFISLLW